MTRPSLPSFRRALLCVLALVSVWLSHEGAAMAQGAACPMPPLLTLSDSGTTVGATNNTATVALACNGIYTQVAGPDVFYEIVLGAGNNFAITVTPSAGYDTSIYLTSPGCGNGAQCAPGWGSDDGLAGTPETMNFSDLAPGIYFLGIDSFYPVTDPQGRSSGTYTVSINGNLGAIATTTGLLAAPSPSAFGQAVTFTGTVSGFVASPIGSVTFSLDSVTQAPVPVDSAGHAVFTTNALTAGVHTIAANYDGSGPYAASSASLMQTVTQAATTTTVISSGSPTMLGGPVTFTAQVAPVAPASGTPMGTVDFSVDGTVQPSVPVAGGTAAFTTSALAVGPHTIVAAYSGDPNFAASTSSALTQTVSGAQSTTTVGATPEPSVYGQPVSFTVTVGSGSGATPTGSVSYTVDGSGAAPLMLSGGQVMIPIPGVLAPGSHTFVATYGGDLAHAGSTGSTMHVVNKAATATTLSLATNPAVSLQLVTLSAAVAAVAPGVGTPAGTVSFYEGSTKVGSGTLNGMGVAALPWAFTVGSHSISAAYIGDTSFLASDTAIASTETVNKADSTTVLVSSANPSAVGQTLTFTASVTVNSPGNGPPTGTVTFSNGTTPLGTGTLDTNGHATLSTSALALEMHTITASYAGDVEHNASASAALQQQVTADAATVGLSSSANPAARGASATFTATVSAAGDAGTPTGTVTFTDGTTTLGTGTLAGGFATYATSTLSGGHHTITATYGGDATFQGGAYASLVETINSAPTTTVLHAMPNPSTFGTQVAFTAIVTSSGGGTPTGLVTFAAGMSNLGSGMLIGNTATFATSSLTVGMYPVQAAYVGDSNFAASVSSVVTEEVTATPGDGGVSEGGSQDAEADAAAEGGGQDGGDAERDSAGEASADSTVGSGDGSAGGDGATSGDGSSSDAGLHSSDGGDGAASGDGGRSTLDASLHLPDGGSVPNGNGGSCSCRTVGADDSGPGVLGLISIVGIAGAFARRRARTRRGYAVTG